LKFIRSIGATLLAWGPWGIFLLALLDSAGIPIPEGVDALVVLMASRNASAGYFSAALAIVGSLAGCLFLFSLARKGGEVYLDRRTQSERAKKFRRWFNHYGSVALFIPALVPVPLPLKVFVLSAGALGMSRVRFALVILAARIPRYFALAYLGSQLGDEPILYVKSHMLQLLGLSVALFLFLLGLVKLKDWMHRRALQKAEAGYPAAASSTAPNRRSRD
jgi:membrane protein YqaA with SNARE-associated domain